jgi:sodium/potassium/calcium exchanger 6
MTGLSPPHESASRTIQTGDDEDRGYSGEPGRLGPLATLDGNLPTWATLVAVGLIFSMFTFVASEDGREPSGVVFAVWVGTGFIMSVAWLFLLANELVDILQSLGLIVGIPNTFLGLTVLAWGNSVGDLVSDLAVARKESTAMAVAAIYAGPMMNLLIGLGVGRSLGSLSRAPSRSLSRSLALSVCLSLALALSLSLSLSPLPLQLCRCPPLFVAPPRIAHAESFFPIVCRLRLEFKP